MCNSNVIKVAAVAAAVYFTGGTALAGAGAGGSAGAATGMTALQTASLVSSTAGLALSGYGAYKQSEAAKQAAQYNAKVAAMQGQDAIDRGDTDQQTVGRKQAAMRGQQTANMAANGLDLSSGSPSAILDQTDYYGLADQATTINNSRREAAGFKSRSAMASAQADAYSPLTTAGASLLTSSGTVADRWYKYQGA